MEEPATQAQPKEHPKQVKIAAKPAYQSPYSQKKQIALACKRQQMLNSQRSIE